MRQTWIGAVLLAAVLPWSAGCGDPMEANSTAQSAPATVSTAEVAAPQPDVAEDIAGETSEVEALEPDPQEEVVETAASLDAREEELARREAEVAARERALAAETEAATREQPNEAEEVWLAGGVEPMEEPTASPAIRGQASTEEPAWEADDEAGSQQATAEPVEELIERDAAVPATTVFQIELLDGVSSETSRIGDVVRAKLAVPVAVDDRVVIPQGSELEGEVVEAVALKKIGGKAQLGIRFAQLVLPSGTRVPVKLALYEEGRSETRRDAATIGGATVAGAILGRAIKSKNKSKGGTIGAILGAAAGAAAAARTEGESIDLAAGERLTLVLEEPITVPVTVRRIKA